MMKPLKIKTLQQLLMYTFGLVPIVAGADKFFNLLTQWGSYLPAGMVDLLPVSAEALMMIVGGIEIAAGILVLTKTELGAYVVSAWLVAIALVLLFSGQHFDVAVRDLVMALSAFVLAQLTQAVQAEVPAEAQAAQYVS